MGSRAAGADRSRRLLPTGGIQGWDDLIYTHVSLRLPGRSEDGRKTFPINPFGLTFDDMTASNLLVIDTEGRVIENSGRIANPSGFAIHGAVHRARADAHCAIHLHADARIAVSALDCGLLPLSQHAIRFWGDIAYHEYEGLALGANEQARLTAELGNHHRAMGSAQSRRAHMRPDRRRGL